jgi:hypothetical protein
VGHRDDDAANRRCWSLRTWPNEAANSTAYSETRLVLEELATTANRELVFSISVGAPKDTQDPAKELEPSIAGSASRFAKAVSRLLDDDFLARQADQYAKEFNKALESDEWIARFPGRLVLAGFVSAHVPGVSYENSRI